MFQLWKLVLLCGLITGTKASILGDLGNNLKDVIDKGREILDNTVETVSGNLKEDLAKLQNSKVGQLSGRVLEQAEDLLANAISNVLSISNDIFGVKISNVQVLGIKSKPSLDGEGLSLSFTIGADVALNLPRIGKTADLRLSTDLLSVAKIETQDGVPKAVVTKCANDPASISLSLLDRRSQLANRLTEAASRLLSKTLSTLVEEQVCPLVSLFVNSLGAQFLQSAISLSQNGVQLAV